MDVGRCPDYVGRALRYAVAFGHSGAGSPEQRVEENMTKRRRIEQSIRLAAGRDDGGSSRLRPRDISASRRS
jgi:hypothetical protein